MAAPLNGLPPELARAAEEHSLVDASLSIPTVIVGYEDSPAQVPSRSAVQRAAVGSFPGDDPLAEARASAVGDYPTQAGFLTRPVEQPPEQAARIIFGMDEDSLAVFQQRLYMAGFYGSTPYEDVLWKRPDVLTLAAAERFMNWASAYRTRDGERVPYDDALDALVGDDDLPELDTIGVGPLELADPVALGLLMDRAAQQTWRRKASPDDKRAFVAFLHGLQRAQQRSLVGARYGGEVTQIDPSAQALAFAERRNPAEALGTQGAQVAEDISGVIG